MDGKVKKAPLIKWGAELTPIEALRQAVAIANEAQDEWDRDNHGRVGKILLALAGFLPKYRPDTDAIHATLQAEGTRQVMLDTVNREAVAMATRLQNTRSELAGCSHGYCSMNEAAAEDYTVKILDRIIKGED
jgi:hypothetical protein